MATHRNYIECLICDAKIITRTSISDPHLEFAFPCPKCSTEIAFALDAAPPSEEARKMLGFIAPPRVTEGGIINGKWFYPGSRENADKFEAEALSTKMFDGDHLTHRHEDYSDGESAFMQNVELVGFDKFEKFQQDALGRTIIVDRHWPTLEQLVLHSGKEQWEFFDRAYAELGEKKVFANNFDRVSAMYAAFESFGIVFRPVDLLPYTEIKRRLEGAERVSEQEVSNLVSYYIAKNKDIDLQDQMFSVRKQWSKLYSVLAPLYITHEWDASTHNLDDYSLPQKRFQELKGLYIDCFETLCRTSVIAATIEGISRDGVAHVPRSRGRSMSIEQFDIMKNGSKPDVLSNLAPPVARLFVPYIDHRLRNGIGHNAARYDVINDDVTYVVENDNGLTRLAMPYIRFCERVLNIYCQLELTSQYLNWLSLKAYTVRHP